ncbi:MAG: hypothetical protein ACOCX2_11755 [Armatimonadota bacterium]
MSLKDLQEHGILLPEEEWGVHDLHTSVNKPLLIVALLFGVAAVVMMYFGGGQTPTFVGMVMFIAFMGWITQISLKAIDVQAAQFAEERQEAHMEGEPLPGESAPQD